MGPQQKPLGIKSYGHIAHLPGSRAGPGDHKCGEAEAIRATKKARDRHERVIVQEKLDGSNVGVAKLEGIILPLTRAGYLAHTSPYYQLQAFSQWAYNNQARFLELLDEGERVCGEWLMQAHGTRYKLEHEPFVAFDVMRGHQRVTYEELCQRASKAELVTPRTFHIGGPLGIEKAMEYCNVSGHGAIDPVEGAVWRVEANVQINPGKDNQRKWILEFIVKYVKPEKIDGFYLPEISGKEPVWNWKPEW